MAKETPFVIESVFSVRHELRLKKQLSIAYNTTHHNQIAALL
jgi:hypothetical protein